MTTRANENRVEDAKGKATAGLLNGLINQGPMAAVGEAYSLLGPETLRNIAYGTKHTKDADRVYDIVEALDAAAQKGPRKYAPIDVAVNSAYKPTFFPAGKEKVLNELTKKYEWKNLPDRIVLPTNAPPETIAHELGHAYSNSRFGDILRSAGMIAGKTPMLALPSAIALAGAVPQTEEVAKAAPYVGALQLAAILGSEAYANIRGAKLLEQAGHSMPWHRKARMFIPTTSYLGQAALLVGMPLAIQKGIEAYKELKKKDPDIKAQDVARYVGKSLASPPVDLNKMPTFQEFKAKWGNKPK